MTLVDKIFNFEFGLIAGFVLAIIANGVGAYREALIRERESREVPHDRG